MKKKASKTKWLIWGGILAVLAVEIVVLTTGGSDTEETDALEKKAVATAKPVPKTANYPKLEQVTFASTKAEEGTAADMPPPVAQANEGDVLNAGNAEDPLPLSLLRERLQSPGALPNEVLLIFKTKQAYLDFLRSAAAAGLTVMDQMDRALTVRAGYSSLERLREEILKRRDELAKASANYVVGVPRLAEPNSPTAGGHAPFGEGVLSAIGVDPSVDRSGWGSGVTVAVVDSGVGEHPTFRADQVTHIDLVEDGLPFEGHGTAMASLIAGNLPGAQGVAPGAQILDVRVAGGKGQSNSYVLAEGIYAAVDHGAKVINISMGSYGDATVVRTAIEAAQASGALVVAAAGNQNISLLAWPAAYPGVISVAGVDAQRQVAYFSNSGNPTIAAPAVGIPSAYYRDNRPFIATGSGTSQAAALVSGVVATIAGQGGNVMLTLNRNAIPLQAPAQAVGAGMVRLPVYR